MLAQWRFERGLRSLANSNHDILSSYALADWPERSMRADQAPFLALDFELDGLRKDAHLLQAGWVPFEGHTIGLTNAHSLDILSDADLDPQAVTIHGIGEQRALRGRPIHEVSDKLLVALAGRILVAHGAWIEQDALCRTVKSLHGAKLPVRCICTLTLERHIHPNLVGTEDYRLGPCRQRYGLPDYSAHDALTDAIAAAELFQAQLTRLPPDTTLAQLEHS